MTDKLLDLRNILYLTWSSINLPNPTDIQLDMAEALEGVLRPVLGLKPRDSFYIKFPQFVDNGVPANRVIIQAGRGLAKSTTTGAIVPWLLKYKKDLNILVLSADRGKADNFSKFSKDLISNMEIYKELIPSHTDDVKWGNASFDVSGKAIDQNNSVRAATIGGTITGGRADVIIADDIEVPNTSDTQGARVRLSERVRELDAILKPNGVIIYLGTPQCQDSVYNELLKRGYRRIVWPSRYPDKAWLDNNPESLSELLRAQLEANPSLGTGGGLDGSLGRPTSPEMYSEEDLQGREASYGRSGFALQYMLDTTLSDKHKYPLRLSDLIVMDMDIDLAPEKPIWSNQSGCLLNIPNIGLKNDGFYKAFRLHGEMLPYKGSIMAIDPSGEGEDETAYAVVKQLNGYLYVAECYGLKGGYNESNLVTLAQIAAKHKVQKILIEKNFGGGMFSELFKTTLYKYHRCQIEDITVHSQKEKRIINCLEPLLNQHRVVVDSAVINKDLSIKKSNPKEVSTQLFHQLTRITLKKNSLIHDDRLDALAAACQYWVESASQDADNRIYSRQKDAHLKEIRDSLNSNPFNQNKPKSIKWANNYRR